MCVKYCGRILIKMVAIIVLKAAEKVIKMCAAILKGFASCLYIRLSSSIEKGDKRGIRPILLTARPKSKYIQTIVNKDAPGYECVNINLIYLFKQIIFLSAKTRIFHDESKCASSADAAELVFAEIIAHIMIAVNDLHALIDTIHRRQNCVFFIYHRQGTNHKRKKFNSPNQNGIKSGKPSQDRMTDRQTKRRRYVIVPSGF